VPRAAVLLLLSLAAPVRAGPVTGRERIDTASGLVLSFSRITAMGGAFVAVAEGQDGVPVNPAAVAHRERHLERGWDWDYVFTYFLPTAADLRSLDVDADGKSDAALSGLGNLQLGLSRQWGRLGVGLLLRVQSVSQESGPTILTVSSTDVSLAAGYALAREELLLAGELAAIGGEVALDGPAGKATRAYRGFQPRAGLLWRPRGKTWRVGLRAVPQAVARPGDGPGPAGLTTPRQVVFPWQVSVGAAAWHGPNARLHNQLPPVAYREDPGLGPPLPYEAADGQPILVSVQLDAVGPAAGSVTAGSFLGQLSGAEAERSGRRVSLALRAGAEWEAWPRWMVLRAGGYLEPTRVHDSLRPHGTFGFDVRVPAWITSLRAGLAADLAPRFRNVGLSLGFWYERGPRPPARRDPSRERGGPEIPP